MDRTTNKFPGDRLSDGLEFAVSQDVDGVLPDFDRRNLGDRLATDAARRWADEDRRVNALLRDHADVPDVDFSLFQARFSAALSEEPAHDAVDEAGPVRLHPMLWRRLSIAAGLMLAATLGWHFLDREPVAAARPIGRAIVQGPSTTMPVGTVAVTVGPSEELQRRGLAQGLGTTPQAQQAAKVVITSVEPSKDANPY